MRREDRIPAMGTGGGAVHWRGMSKSKMIRAGDAAELIRAVAEAYESSGDPARRLSHLVTAGCRIIGARLGSGCLVKLPGGTQLDDASTGLLACTEGGDWTAHDRDIVRTYEGSEFASDPMVAGIMVVSATRGCDPAMLREQVIPDDAWYRSGHVNECRRASDMDSCIYSGIPGRSGPVSVGMTFHRGWNEKPLGERERALVELLQVGAAPLFYAFEASVIPPDDAIARLPPRLKDVLAALARGDSEKQVALRLGLAKHTVHSHVKRLHKAFGVHSRSELFAAIRERGLTDSLTCLIDERKW